MRGEHAAHIRVKLVWCTVYNCGGMKCYSIAARIFCVCARFVDAVLGHVMCMKRKNGFMVVCK